MTLQPPLVGVGLKFKHFSDILATKTHEIDFFEVHAENCFGQRVLDNLSKIRQSYNISIHGIGLSLGSAEPVSQSHLEFLKTLIDRYDPFLVSEHVSWSASQAIYTNDLLPLPYTEEALQALCRNIDRTQIALDRQILIENPSTYLAFKQADYSETDFIKEACSRTGCGLLLDVNNAYVSAKNLGFDPYDYIDAVACLAPQEIHLAGHVVSNIGTGSIRIDDHGSLVSRDVWDLYSYTLNQTGRCTTLIEWDNNVPPFDVFIHQATYAKRLLEDAPEARHQHKSKTTKAA